MEIRQQKMHNHVFSVASWDIFFARKQNEDKNVLERGEINRDRMKYWAGVLEMCFSSPLAEECGFHRQKHLSTKIPGRAQTFFLYNSEQQIGKEAAHQNSENFKLSSPQSPRFSGSERSLSSLSPFSPLSRANLGPNFLQS